MRAPELYRASPKKITSFNRDWAEGVAVAALAHMAENHELLSHFLEHTGLKRADIREAAADPGFFGEVLGFLSANERDCAAFAQKERLTPDQLSEARRLLG